MSVLITGATGYLGSRVVGELARRNIPVTCLVRPGSESKLKIGGVTVLSTEESVESLSATLRKQRVRSILHLATLFVAEHSSSQIPELLQSNIALGTKVAEAASLAGVPGFLNIGTFWQHYEGRAYSPVSLYAATKQAFEDILRYYAEAKGLAVTTLKFAGVYGPDDPRQKIVNLLITQIKGAQSTSAQGASVEAPIRALEMSPGEQLVDLIYVDDAVRAVLRGMELLDRPGEYRSYSVTSGHMVTLRELVAVIESTTGRRIDVKWGAKSYRQREFFTNWVSDPLLPGWSAETPLDQGLARLL